LRRTYGIQMSNMKIIIDRLPLEQEDPREALEQIHMDDTELNEEDEVDSQPITIMPISELLTNEEELDSLDKIRWGYDVNSEVLFEPDLGIAIKCHVIAHEEGYYHLYARLHGTLKKVGMIKRNINVVIGTKLPEMKNIYLPVERLKEIKYEPPMYG